MSPAALGLLLLSAMFHVGWNLLMKQTGNRHITAWLATIVGSLVFLPLPIFYWQALQPVWGFVIISALLQVLYYTLLGFAYNRGDFSLVYPIARGTAPLFIALWSVLFLHEVLSWSGIAGLATIVLGVMIIGVGVWYTQRQGGALPLVSLAAPLMVALCISFYSVVDGAAVRYTEPLPYTVVSLGLSAVFLSPFILRRYGWPAVRREWDQHWGRICLIGLGTILAYGLVLVSYTMAKVSYGGAVREISIVLAALVGWLWLGEAFGLTRTLGAVVVCVGIVLVTLAG